MKKRAMILSDLLFVSAVLYGNYLFFSGIVNKIPGKGIFGALLMIIGIYLRGVFADAWRERE